MKKLMSLLALAVVGSVVAASAEEVLSANAVGYVKKTIKGGDLLPIVMPFDLLNSDVSDGIEFIKTQLAEDLKPGSLVYFWSKTDEIWESALKEDDPDDGPTWANRAKNKKLDYGEMFFVKPATDGDYTLAGEVPDTPKTDVGMRGKGSLNAVGFAYPTPVRFLDTDLAANAPFETIVYFWDLNAKTWASAKLEDDPDDGPTWGALARNKTLEPGEGFFVKFPGDSGLTSWEQGKPYDWP